jgi:hypothetical protein
VELQDPHFAYKAYIKALTRAQDDQAQLANIGFQLDWNQNGDVNGMNSGALLRAKWAKDAPNGYEMKGKLEVDFFSAEAYLIPATPMKVVLTKADPSFYILTSLDVQYKFDIDDLYLTGVSIETLPSLLGEIERTLEVSEAKFRYDSTVVRQLGIPRGLQSIAYNHLYQGLLPRKILIGFVSQEAQAGNSKVNPYNFRHLKVRKVTFNVNGSDVKTITTDFTHGQVLEAYTHFLQWAGLEDAATPIHRHVYAIGNAFFCYDALQNCPESQTCNEELLQKGVINIKVEFQEPLEEACTMMAFGTRASEISISKARTVEVTNSTV